MAKMAWIKDDFQLWMSGQLGPFPQGACVHIKLYGQEVNPRTGESENMYFAASTPDKLSDFDNPTLFESDFEQII
jgi:hypothetical protein